MASHQSKTDRAGPGIDLDPVPARDLPSGTDFGRFRFPDLGRFLPGPILDQSVLVSFGPWETLRLDPQLESAPGLAGEQIHSGSALPRAPNMEAKKT